MDGHLDTYGDQYLSTMPDYDPEGMPAVSRGGRSGHYEDSLRFAQYGVPARLNCANPDPYIQDDIAKSQRHKKPSPYNMDQRLSMVARNSCEPGLVGESCARSMGQASTIPSKHGCPGAVGWGGCGGRACACGGPACVGGAGGSACAACSACGKNSGKKSGGVEVDGMMLLYMFIFIVVVLMVVQYWKSISELKMKIAAMGSTLSNSSP